MHTELTSGVAPTKIELPELDAVTIVEEAKALFGDNTFQRVVHYCREATLWMRSRPDVPWSPRNIAPFIQGDAGYGKTSIIREYARVLGIEYRERKLAGINDIAEVFGMVATRTNPETGEVETVLAKPDWWPKEGTTGVINWDDQ